MEPIEIQAISRSPQTPKLHQHLKFTLLFVLIFSSLTLGILCILLLIPSSPASSSLYSTLYFTNNFEPGKFLYFIFLLTLSKTYLTSTTLKNYLRATRKSPESISDTILYQTTNFVLFLFGPNATLQAWSSDFSYISAIIYNYCCFTIPYIIALHITYLISGVVIKVTINYEEVWRWSYRSWAFLGVIVATIFGLIGYQLFLLYLYSRIIIYATIYAVGIVVLFGILKCVRGIGVITDWFWLAAFVVPITATPSIISAVLQGTFLGIYTEGVARVGFKNIFVNTSE